MPDKLLSATAPVYAVADFYATVEQEALATFGKPIFLLRLAHPPQLVHAHLTSLRPMPHRLYNWEQLFEATEALQQTNPLIKWVHIVGDWPEINCFEDLVRIFQQLGLQISLNTYGTVALSTNAAVWISDLYVILKPGLTPLRSILEEAREIRLYYTNDQTDDFRILLNWWVSEYGRSSKLLGKTYVMPFDLEPETIKGTLDFCLQNGVRFFVPMCRLANYDLHLQTNPKSVEIFHLQDAQKAKGSDPYPRLKQAQTVTL